MKYTRIEIAVKPEIDDPFAKHVKWEITTTLGYEIRNVRLVSVYTVYSDLNQNELELFARDVLCDPVLSFYAIGKPAGLKLEPFDWAVEVSFKQGVTDNVGHTATQVLQILARHFGNKNTQDYRVYKSTQYLIDANLKPGEVEKICSEVLYNDLIEDIDILSHNDFIKKSGFPVKERHYNPEYEPRVTIFNLNIPDEELLKLSQDRVLALTLDEMKYFRSYFEDPEIRKERIKAGISADPTDVELESFAQTQSEHCKHKIFNARITYKSGKTRKEINSIFKTYIKGATERISKHRKWLVSVFEDNAGVIEFNENYNLAFKVETHNTPSALDPYGGAITGIVGCDRDPAGTGLGARIIAHTDYLCFGNPFHRGELPPKMMHPKRIMEGVIKGIEDGGNKCGIPTVNGGIIFDPSYSGKPLVYCGSVGIMPKEIDGVPTHIKKALPGDIIVMVGGKIGKDGIHGATFSSEEIKETSPSQAVQIGDPITQKKMLDMLLEAEEQLLYRGITDNGAGGLSSSVGEMALLSGGAYLELEHAPLKYPGLDPWEILLSEAQERMTLAVPPENLDRFLELARRRDVLATPIGKFTDTGYFHVTYRGKTVCYLKLEFLHSNIPMHLEAEWTPPHIDETRPELDGKSMEQIIERVVTDLNSCSREPVIRRYDHEVGGATVVKPLIGSEEVGPSDGGVISPVPGDRRGFVLSGGINPFISRVDTYRMAALAVDEAVRNAVTVGADPERIALLDNFCWPDPVYDEDKTPDGKYKLAQLVRAAEGLYDTAIKYNTPFISGKDSMKNDYKIGKHKISVLPTILVSSIGIVPDISKSVTSDFKDEGDAIYILGHTENHMGESLFYRIFGGSSAAVPVVKPEDFINWYRAYFEAVKAGIIKSGHDISEGGLAVALTESSISGKIGSEVWLKDVPSKETLKKDEIILFSESAGRILFTVAPENESLLKEIMSNIPCRRIGRVGGDSIKINGIDGRGIAEIDVKDITIKYRRPLYEILGMQM